MLLLVGWQILWGCCLNAKEDNSIQDYKYLIGERESGGNYGAKNSLGYIGKYQFGKGALQDTGFKDSHGEWAGKYGIRSEQDFLTNPRIQEEAMEYYTKLQLRYLKNKGTYKFIGKKIKGIIITESGLAAGAHLVGAGGLNKMLNTGIIKKDAYGTPATEYIDKFKNIDLNTEDMMKKLEELKKMRDFIKYNNGGIASEIDAPQVADTIPLSQETVKETYTPAIPADNAPKEVKEASVNAPVTLSTLEQDYRNLMGAAKEERNSTAWMNAMSQVASQLDKYAAEPVGIKPIAFKSESIPAEMNENLTLAKLKVKSAPKAVASLSPYQEKSLGLQKRRLELMEGKEDRLGDKDELQAEYKTRLSDKEVKSMSDFDEGTRLIGEVSTLLNKDNVKENIGPYASRIEDATSLLPFVEKDSDFVKMKQLIGTQLADYVKSISGSAVSEEEANRLRENIPNMTDKPGEFKVKMKTFNDILKGAKATYLENIGKQKSSAEKFKDKEEPSKPKVPPIGTIVVSEDKRRYRVIDDNGDVEEIK